jgi:hypothetical protein
MYRPKLEEVTIAGQMTLHCKHHIFHSLTACYWDNHVKEDELSEACGMHGGDKNRMYLLGLQRRSLALGDRQRYRLEFETWQVFWSSRRCVLLYGF